MNKFFILIFSFIFLSNISYSQDEKAKKILEDLSKKGKSFEDFTAEFSFNFFNKSQGIDEYSEGKIWVKDDMYKLDISSDLSIINNGETLWYFMKDVPEVQIMDSDPEDEMNPSKIFTIYESGYKYKYEGKSIIDNKKVENITLFPKESVAISKVILQVDTDKLELYKIQIIDKDGGTSIYTINSFNVNSNLSESKFNFKKKNYPGVEIIDLR
tara:strand:+ start:1304 stop:1942 length:639 start_codon:yes stop_codon:yes gene_type:complete